MPSYPPFTLIKELNFYNMLNLAQVLWLQLVNKLLRGNLELKDLIEKGIIEPQTEVSYWCSQGFFTSKKGSVKPHFVVDYVPLNKEIIRSHWPFTDADHA